MYRKRIIIPEILKYRRLVISALIISVVIVLSSMTFSIFANLPNNGNDETVSRISSSQIPGMVLLYQHKDTNMIPCTAGPPCLGVIPDPIHVWNDAAGVDGIYGNADDCPHCSAYCAPASIAMIATYRLVPPPMNQQDDLYDAGKVIGEVGLGDMIINSHGAGMFDGSGGRPPEVQTSFLVALGPFIQHDFMIPNPLTPAQLETYIYNWHPVLWLDHGGWPANQSAQYPPLENKSEQGHAKVIAGYDNKSTADTSDDLCLIYDPWPEYNDLLILPTNATKGPGGTFDPYWLPLNDVNLADISDIFLVDTFPDIPEFSLILIPVMGIALIAIIAMRASFRDRKYT